MTVRPVMVRSEDQFIQLMRGRRNALKLGQAELDDRIGWAPGYTSKIEAPHRRYGRRLFMFFTNLADELLEGLGLALVLMDRREAAKLCAESALPVLEEAHAGCYPNRAREGGLVQSRTLRITTTYRKAA
jgi:hypothetical protein